MKKFKLIKEYPRSLLLGSIVVENKKCGYDYIKHPGECSLFSTKEVENYPEFWREVEELCVPLGTKFTSKLDKGSGYIYTLHSSFNIAPDFDDFVDITWNCGAVGKVSEVYPIKEINKYFSEGEWIVYNEPVKLFTTEDGVDIYEGDTYYSVHVEGLQILDSSSFTPIFPNLHDWRGFSTKEEAEDYILMNKPCLSIKEITNIVGIEISNHRYVYPSGLLKALKALVKDKL